MKTACIISLGCARNLVDSEVLTGSLKECGFKILPEGEDADLYVINTCSFIENARKESVDTILEVSGMKKEGKTRHIVVTGCLPQLYKDGIGKALPEVDLFLGTSDFHRIKDFLNDINAGNQEKEISCDPNFLYDENSPRFLLTPRHYAYIKISEGCSNFCSYCIISDLRGTFRSRTIESIEKEYKELSSGTLLKEINLIGQDTTLYGIDRYGKLKLPELLKRLDKIESSVRWIRLLYTHPAHYSDELIKAIKSSRKICGYLDIPIQHISDKILKAMNRHTSKKDVISLVGKLRKNIPGVALRTSIIVGFPGETEKDFSELLDFLREARFERLGAFTYSREEGTKAASLKGHVNEKVKKERLDRLMKLQRSISEETNAGYIGKVIKVLVDEKGGEEGLYIGRSEHDAPEVDGSVYIKGRGIKVGGFCDVKITSSSDYDLAGELI